MTRRAERRGSIQQYTPSQWYKDTLKGSILHTVGAEGQSAVIAGFEFALDGMLNVHASLVNYWKPTVTLRKCMYHAHLWEGLVYTWYLVR